MKKSAALFAPYNPPKVRVCAAHLTRWHYSSFFWAMPCIIKSATAITRHDYKAQPVRWAQTLTYDEQWAQKGQPRPKAWLYIAPRKAQPSPAAPSFLHPPTHPQPPPYLAIQAPWGASPNHPARHLALIMHSVSRRRNGGVCLYCQHSYNPL